MSIDYYCPVCDTPLIVQEFDVGAEDNPEEPGYDLYMDCPACGWCESVTAQSMMCVAWGHMVGRLKASTMLIREPGKDVF